MYKWRFTYADVCSTHRKEVVSLRAYLVSGAKMVPLTCTDHLGPDSLEYGSNV